MFFNFGKHGEKAAKQYLENLGYHIVTTNYKSCGAEIDIIARDNKAVVFIEVKSSWSECAAYRVDHSKKQKIAKAVEGYLYRNKLYTVPVRFEIISVVIATQKITHFQEEFFDF